MFHIRLILLINRKNKQGKFTKLQVELSRSLMLPCDLVPTGFYNRKRGNFNTITSAHIFKILIKSGTKTSFSWSCYDNELRLKEVELRNVKEEMYQGTF